MTAEAHKAIPLRRNGVFAVWWITQFASNIGTSISALALPLLALRAVRTPAGAGWILGAADIGVLVAAPVTGLVADRFRRAQVMLAANLALAAASIGLGLLAAASDGSELVVALTLYAFFTGAFGCLMFAAAGGILPHIVDDSQLETAFARNSARQTMAQIIGPLLGGALFTVGSGLPFLVDAGSYAVAALGNTAMIRKIPVIPRDIEQAEDHGTRALTGGLRLIAGNRLLRMLVVNIVVLNLCFAALSFVIIVRARGLGASPTAIGMLSVFAAVGALAGTFLVGPALERLGQSGALATATMVLASGLLLIATVDRLAVIAVAFAVMFLAAPVIESQIFAQLTRSTPDRLLGRVNASLRACTQGLQWAAPGLAGLAMSITGASRLSGLLAVAMTVAGVAVMLTMRADAGGTQRRKAQSQG